MQTSDPDAEIEISEELIMHLIHSQFPEFAGFKLTFLDSGWDNENYRLGKEYMVRLPRRSQSAQLIIHENKWLKNLNSHLPLEVPTPVKLGKPTEKYPWDWSIIPWYEGTTANLQLPNQSEAFKLIDFLAILHNIETKNAPKNSFRDGPLQNKKDTISQRIERLKKNTYFITPKIESLWEAALKAPTNFEKCLIHGDLHPRNIIVQHKKLKAVIDWGDITLGDPALDLASMWMLFENKKIRDDALLKYKASEQMITRAIGWAIFFAITLLDTGLNSNTQHSEIGIFTLKNLYKQ